jgi:hypothetical protein
MHLDILCSLTKFCKKKIIFVTGVKKTIFYATKLLFTQLFFIIFTQATKNVLSHQNFDGWT